jgi:TM2 domain-containing membrane protein YozV
MKQTGMEGICAYILACGIGVTICDLYSYIVWLHIWPATKGSLFNGCWKRMCLELNNRDHKRSGGWRLIVAWRRRAGSAA